MSPRPARVPRTINSATRTEVAEVALRVLEGELPPDLRGHVFVVGAVGSFSSGSLPRALHRTTTTLNGDGMVYRFDFRAGEVRLTTRLVRTDDFRLDEGLSASAIAGPRFSDYGFVRFSRGYGVRNQANTAFLPIPAARPGGLPRLLITWDAGRPVELDTETLEVATTVGRRDEWTPEAVGLLPLPPTFASAHPAVDTKTGEIFTANFGKGLLGLAGTVPGLRRPTVWLRDLIRRHPREPGPQTAGSPRPPRLLRFGVLPVAAGMHVLRRHNRTARHLLPSRFTVLVRWDGRGAFEHFLLRDGQDGRRVGIRQSMHQLALTDEYVVLLDSAFEIGLASLLSNFFPDGRLSERLRAQRGSLGDRGIDVVERFLRARVTAPNLPVGSVYFVRRSDLETTQERSAVKPDEWKVVTARRVDLPGPVVHFLADPDDRDGTRVFELYRDDAQRVVPADVVRDRIAAEGRWTQLFRVDLDRMVIVDSFTLDATDDGPRGPVGRMIGSPQFIPRQEDSDQLDGWISAFCYRDQSVELLIFDAADLAAGPRCRLALPVDVDPGFLLHSAWLPRIGPRQAAYRVDPNLDYEYPLRPSPTRVGRAVERLFEQDAVRAAFERFVKHRPA